MKKILISFFLLALVFSSGGFILAATPDGAAGPWADFVVSYTPGTRDNGTPIDPARTNPNAALGVAENNDTINFVALGYGGNIVLGFYNGIANGDGPDFEVVETTYGNTTCANYPERAKLEVSQDGLTWYEATSPADDCQDLLFDLNDVQLSCINYVRITDTTVFSQFPSNVGHITDGYDVDGVRALHEGGDCVAGNIKITKSANNLEVMPGEDVLYTYLVENTGVVDLYSVSVSDNKCGPVSGPTGDDGDGILNPSEIWSYSCTTFHLETTTNIAEVVAYNSNQDEVSDTDTLTVAVAAPTCTLTQGYWKTHNMSFKDGKHSDSTWTSVDFDHDGNFEGPDETFFYSGNSYYGVLWTAPKGGNAYYQLAHQYIAARLNKAAGAYVPAGVESALNSAFDLFHNPSNTPNEIAKLKGSARTLWLNLANTLGSYNEGLIGPGHCSE